MTALLGAGSGYVAAAALRQLGHDDEAPLLLSDGGKGGRGLRSSHVIATAG